MSDITTFNDSSNDISLPLDNKAFADIVLNFLGNKETLTYEDDIAFLLRLNDLEQFFYLVNEKVSKEHNVFIEHFLVRLGYSDNTKRELSGIEQLNKFIETRDVSPVDVTLTWNIILKYPGASNIENQKIELTFLRNEKANNFGKVVLNIRHTNQSWGIEILNLVKSKITEVSIQAAPQYTFAKNISKTVFNKDVLFTFPMMIFLMYIVMGIVSLESNEKSERFYKISEIWAENPQLNGAEQISFAAANLNSNFLRSYANNYHENTKWHDLLLAIAEKKFERENFITFGKSVLFVGSWVGIFALLAFWIRQTVKYYGVNCYILVNRRSENEYNGDMNKKSKLEYFSVSAVLISIVCSLVANLTFQLFT